MNAFDLRRALLDDYRDYVTSFLRVKDARISRLIQDEIRQGLLWPPARIQLNPAFEPGGAVDELVETDALHPRCRSIFRVGKSAEDPTGRPLVLHRHQARAIEAARTGANYVLTTGTGSGKSLAYIVPIVDLVLREGGGRGVRAIVVYPMNALANSQLQELEKFLASGEPSGPPVRVARYTGQEDHETREAILADPPDVLLTNYVMLELLLTRPRERKLVCEARQLRFLVLDELHTYRGRQGSDVAMLVRRVREASGAQVLQCVGTSATIAGGGSPEEQRAEIARVASQIFGAEVLPGNVIGETLRRATVEYDVSDPSVRERLAARVDAPETVPGDGDGFRADPLASWIESELGLAREPRTRELVRATPRPILGPGGLAEELARLTGRDAPSCESAIEGTLMRGQTILRDDAPFPVFAFRVHQFVSRGDTVYATAEPEDQRHLTVTGRLFAPGGRERRLFPLVFCRECGQEYYSIRLHGEEAGGHIESRDPTDRLSDADEGEAGFLYASTQNPWPADAAEAAPLLPDDWLEGNGRVKSSMRGYLPRRVRVLPDGQLAEDGGLPAFFVRTPFRLCLNCGVAYSGRLGSDFPRVGTLGSEGRSTATTIMGSSLIRALRRDGDALPRRARKLLSFTDNRQDASLQAGHFNDFVEVGVLRAALFAAASEAGDDGLDHDRLAAAVLEAMDLPLDAYAANPTARFGEREYVDQAMRDVIGYRLYMDQQRGWRITSPNLEQTGLLTVHYRHLDQVCAAEDLWEHAHPALAAANPEQRATVARAVLDTLRRELALDVHYLDPAYQDRILQRSRQHLAGRWALDDQESMTHWSLAYPRPRMAGDFRGATYLSGRGGVGRLARRAFAAHAPNLKADDADRILRELLAALRVGGIVQQFGDGDAVPGYRVRAAALAWHAGSGGEVPVDPIRVPNAPNVRRVPNHFFLDLYRKEALQAPDMEGREHTAQVPAEERIVREEAFRDGRLPILFCSPTMELGVDIAELNVVNMRNVPPTPANYAQRSGRAGRSGQPALVVTYCSTGSPHDQYFFRRPERMVSGQVAPPRLDLANEDLIRAHVHAIWLAETGEDLGRSLRDVLDLDDRGELRLQDHLATGLSREEPRQAALARVRHMLASVEDDLRAADWYHPMWAEEALSQAFERFDRACDRWRTMYRTAAAQRDLQNDIAKDPSRPAEDRKRARRLRDQAEAQIELLISADEALNQSDFYSYRYFASEGFLPGYSFPRLPLAAFIPARRRGRDKEGEFISRPRFLAISEFGPRSIIYHEGARYVVNQVTLPVERGDGDATTLPLREAKRCDVCGYLHPVEPDRAVDVCERCGADLGAPISRMLRLTNVATRRRERITSDEEERLRLGYDIVTGVRFARRDEGRAERLAQASASGGTPLLSLAYGPAATIWRINLGWARRLDKHRHGFVLDVQSGYWARNEDQPDDPEDPMGARQERVVPFVDDRRNVLVIHPAAELLPDQTVSLMTALANAIQVVYQLEPAELAAEPLPDVQRPRAILLYESAEGGAGVLRHLTEEPGALPAVAREALRICHFDPDTGDDVGAPPHLEEACEAACYDCLMSYGNQRFHPMLDRRAIKDTLLALAVGTVAPGPAGHLDALLARCDSELERRWLRLVARHGLRLPDEAQALIADAETRPDFLYRSEMIAVYVDGPVHEFPERRERDAQAESRMRRLGYTVLRFGGGDDWDALLAEHAARLGGASPGGERADAGPDDGLPPLDLFPPSWHQLITRLRESGIDVHPGEDVLDGSTVVGTSAAVARRRAATAVLVDASEPAAAAVLAAVEDAGGVAIAVDPADGTAEARIDAGLGGG